MLTVRNLSLFTASFSCSDSTGFRAGAGLSASRRVVAAKTASWTSLCHLPGFYAALFRAHLWIWAVFYARWTHAACGTGLDFSSSFVPAGFLADCRSRTNLTFRANAPLRTRFYRRFTPLSTLVRCNSLGLLGLFHGIRDPGRTTACGLSYSLSLV